MAEAARKIEGIDADDENPEKIREREEMDDIRDQISDVADQSLQEGVIDLEAHRFYKQLSRGQAVSKELEKKDKLKGMLDFAKEYAIKSIKIQQKLEKEVPANDGKYLMEKLVTDNIDFMKQADAVDRLINEKIDRIKQDIKLFGELSDHPYTKELSITVSDKIKLGDEKSFLEAKTPDRRAFLKAVQELFWKKEVEEAMDEKNAEKLTRIYEAKLRRRLCNSQGKNGSMGQKTFNAFLEGFKQMAEEKNFVGMEYWHKDFENQMKDRDAFFDEMRHTVREDGLRELEGSVHFIGFTELKERYKAMLKPDSKESKRLENQYGGKLEEYRNVCASDHSIKAFKEWFAALPLKGRYTARDRIDTYEGMGRLMEQWERIKKLPPEQQLFMEQKRDDPNANWGYTEFQKQLEEFERQGVGVNLESAEAEEALAGLNDSEKRAVLSARKVLMKLGQTNVDQMAQVIHFMTDGLSQAQIDQMDHDQEVAAEIERLEAEQESLIEPSANQADYRLREVPTPVQNELEEMAQEEDAEVDPALEIDERTDNNHPEAEQEKLKRLERSEELKVSKVSAFKKVQNRQGERNMEVMVNDMESARSFAMEDNRKAVRSEARGGKDKVSFTFDMGSGKRKFNAKSLNALEKLLRAKRSANDSNYGNVDKAS